MYIRNFYLISVLLFYYKMIGSVSCIYMSCHGSGMVLSKPHCQVFTPALPLPPVVAWRRELEAQKVKVSAWDNNNLQKQKWDQKASSNNNTIKRKMFKREGSGSHTKCSEPGVTLISSSATGTQPKFLLQERDSAPPTSGKEKSGIE